MDSGKQKTKGNAKQAKTINVLLFRVGERPSLMEIPNTNESYQELVGGYYRPFVLDPDAGLAVVFDDDGKLKNKPANRELSFKVRNGIYKEVIVGDFFVCKISSAGELSSYEPSLRAAAIFCCGVDLP